MHLYEEIRPNEIVLLHAWAVRLSFLGTVIQYIPPLLHAALLALEWAPLFTIIYFNCYLICKIESISYYLNTFTTVRFMKSDLYQYPLRCNFLTLSMPVLLIYHLKIPQK